MNIAERGADWLLARLLADRPLTPGDFKESIAAGCDDSTAMAEYLDVEVGQLEVVLTGMTDKGLLIRWNDNGVTRYRVPGGRSAE